VIGIGADDSESLLERHFDFESQAVDSDDLQGIEIQVGAHQQDLTAPGVIDGHESDEDADRSPEEVGGPEPEGHLLFAIDGAGGLLELAGILEQGGDLDLLAVLLASAPGLGPVGRWRFGREPGHAVALGPGDEVVSLGQ